MSQIKEINDQILVSIIKDDPFYETMWGKEEFIPDGTITEPNDYNCGAIANGLEYVNKIVDELIEPNIDTLDAPYVDIAVYFFTQIQRTGGETNADLIKRMQSLLVREGDYRSERWGTPWDLLNILGYHLSRDFLFYVPNKVATDIAVNGKFETVIGAEWILLPSGARSTGDSFDGGYKLDFTTTESASQTFAVTANTYILHAFINPITVLTGITDILYIKIQRDSDSYYFDTTAFVWQAINPNNVFSSDSAGYQLLERFIVADGSYNLTVTFEKILAFYLDYVEFGAKEYPYFEIIYIDEGLATGFASAWDTAETTYTEASFVDQDFLLGSFTASLTDTYYQSLLDTAKSAGVKALFNRRIKL